MHLKISITWRLVKYRSSRTTITRPRKPAHHAKRRFKEKAGRLWSNIFCNSNASSRADRPGGGCVFCGERDRPTEIFLWQKANRRYTLHIGPKAAGVARRLRCQVDYNHFYDVKISIKNPLKSVANAYPALPQPGAKVAPNGCHRNRNPLKLNDSVPKSPFHPAPPRSAYSPASPTRASASACRAATPSIEKPAMASSNSRWKFISAPRRK